MRLIIPDVSTYFDFDELVINRLVIESPLMWRKILQALRNHIVMGIEYARVYDKTKELNFVANTEIIFSPIEISANQTRLLSKLHKALSLDCVSGEQLIKTYALRREIQNYFEHFIYDKEFNLVYNEDFDMVGLFKAVGVKFDEAPDDVVDNLLDYMLCIQELDGEKIFILIGLGDYLCNEEKREFYKTVLGKGLKIFLIDRALYDRNEMENLVIIDADLCEI